ncbi:alpha/beta fold hydrolase [Rhodobacteraceae bacterium DSL-40]|uniref:alpha/beta fold hydrolase n=1 Tax=Amaricoccus sp. B4 TaxID=3368557 RepID=UPI0013A6E3A0
MVQPAPQRVGQPSPLVFHLGAALAAYSQALLAAPRADCASFPWVDGLGELAARLGPDLDRIEIACELASRLRETIEGLEIWQSHPYRRTLEDPPAIWSEGCSRLLDFGQVSEASNPEGEPLLIVPSLINRSYILDLAPGRSLLRWLAGRGFRPLMLDWGAPGLAEAGFGLEEYGACRLAPALAHVAALTGRPVPAIGYCMGGTLAAGLAARRPEGLSRLVTIGAPWDFASTDGLAGTLRAMMRSDGGAEKAQAFLRALADAFGFVPVAVFQMLFALINPLQTALKFQKLARMAPDGAGAQFFVALEDWLADGVPMPCGAAQDLLVGWQVENRTAMGRWDFLGGPVQLDKIEVPVLSFCGRSDSIAPPSLSEALPCAIPDARLIRPRTGHVGMVVGSGARTAVWQHLAQFLV